MKTTKYWELHKKIYNEEFYVLDKEVQELIIIDEKSEEAKSFSVKVERKIFELIERDY